MKQVKPIGIGVLTREISRLLEEGIGYVQVIGEVSNYKHHTSGHKYFSLKDDLAQISAVMWKTRSLSFVPRDGMKVIAGGMITIYPPQGKYQLDCTFMQPLGLGDLYMAFEEMKKRLEEEGLFDLEHKKRLPAIPTRVGIITSATGAAIQDMLSTMKRRNPLCSIVVRPTLVQGDGAAEDIVDALYSLDSQNVDVIIVGRGGGSLEDLWAFNTEPVARAIFDITTPIISAVGHETDFTIADFVADIRAATPTAAAELVTPITLQQMMDYIGKVTQQLPVLVSQSIHEYQRSIDQLLQRGGFKRVQEHIKILQQTVDSHEMRLSVGCKRIMTTVSTKLEAKTQHCKSLYPLSPLQKGFALLEKNAKILSVNDILHAGEEVTLIRQNNKNTVLVQS